MLDSMSPELQRQFENYAPYDMLQGLKSMFEKQAEVERFDLIQMFHACKQEKGFTLKVATSQVLAIQGGRIQKPNKKPQDAKGKSKAKGKCKNKLAYAPKPKNPSPAKKEHMTKDATCNHCKEVGH
ncbi:hypothetical protein Tco_1347650 [Tanacetum coccineum]